MIIRSFFTRQNFVLSRPRIAYATQLQRCVILSVYTFEYCSLQLTSCRNFGKTRGKKITIDARRASPFLLSWYVALLHRGYLHFSTMIGGNDRSRRRDIARKLRINFRETCNSSRLLSDEISCHRVRESLILQCRVILSVYTFEYRPLRLTSRCNFGKREGQDITIDALRASSFLL